MPVYCFPVICDTFLMELEKMRKVGDGNGHSFWRLTKRKNKNKTNEQAKKKRYCPDSQYFFPMLQNIISFVLFCLIRMGEGGNYTQHTSLVHVIFEQLVRSLPPVRCSWCASAYHFTEGVHSTESSTEFTWHDPLITKRNRKFKIPFF